MQTAYFKVPAKPLGSRGIDHHESPLQAAPTPLHRAVGANDYPAVAGLLECGADLEARDNDGRTARDLAREYYHSGD